MITGQDIIYISSIEWTFIWQQNQEIALRLGRAGNRVLYIENTGVRAPGLSDAGRVVARLKNWAGSLASRGVREVAPNVYVCSPLVLPPFGSRIQRRLNRYVLLPLIRRAARRLHMRDVLLWTYLPTDTALDLIRLFRGPQSAIVYYCLADFPQLSSDPDKVAQSEKSLVELSDVVFANCTKLSRRLGQWTNEVAVFPPGVDLNAFPNEEPHSSDGAKFDEDEELIPSLPWPIIGYIGGLHRHVDFDLLAEMAASRPDWSWVFVGPHQASVEKLIGRPNIHLLGPKPHEHLVRYLRSFDVCIVPYVKSVYTETVVPVKVNEYLAARKPVVSTNLPTICEFNERHHVLITTENRADQFLKAIEQALHLPQDLATIARRREVAAFCDWNTQLEAMSQSIEAEMKRQRSESSQSRRAGQQT